MEGILRKGKAGNGCGIDFRNQILKMPYGRAFSERKHKLLSSRSQGFFLAALVLCAVFLAAGPIEVQAAKSFHGKGTSAVSITDAGCYGNTGKITYIRLRPSVTGSLTIKAKSATKREAYSYGSWTLCDSKKKAIGQANEPWSAEKGADAADYTRTYGVRKDETYYLAVKAYGGVKLSARLTEVSQGTNSSRAKARVLARKEKTAGLLIAGETRTDWYRIDLASKQRIVLTYTAKTNGDSSEKNYGIKITFCKEDGTPYASFAGGRTYDRLSVRSPSKAVRVCYTKDGSDEELKIPAGVYYVKVERMNKASSGYYTLKWKTY